MIKRSFVICALFLNAQHGLAEDKKQYWTYPHPNPQVFLKELDQLPIHLQERNVSAIRQLENTYSKWSQEHEFIAPKGFLEAQAKIKNTIDLSVRNRDYQSMRMLQSFMVWQFRFGKSHYSPLHEIVNNKFDSKSLSENSRHLKKLTGCS